MKEASNDRFADDVKESIEGITPRDGGKERMYDNILRKAEKERRYRGRMDGVLRYAMPVAACLCVVIAGAVYGINKNNNAGLGDAGTLNATSEQNIGDEIVMGGNPFADVDGADAFWELGINLDAPSGAENISYSIIDGEIAHISFELDGHEYILRASYQSGDFTGIYGEEMSAEIIDAKSSACLYVIEDRDKNYIKVHWSDGKINYYLANTDGADEEAVKNISIELIDRAK